MYWYYHKQKFHSYSSSLHCVENNSWWWPMKLLPSNIFVTFGHSNLGNAMNMSVKSILIHPNYTWNEYNIYSKDNDLALLKLSNDLEFNDAIQPISLSSPNYTMYNLISEELIFGGYGSLEVDTEEENIMKKLKVYLTMSACNNYSEQVDDEDESVLFSSTNGLWYGDSGGPLIKLSSNFTNPEVVGIAMALETCSNESIGTCF